MGHRTTNGAGINPPVLFLSHESQGAMDYEKHPALGEQCQVSSAM